MSLTAGANAPTETGENSAAPEGDRTTPPVASPKGAAIPPIPAPPEARPGKRGPGRPRKDGLPSGGGASPPAVVAQGAQVVPGATATPAAPAGPPPWRDPAVMADARDSAMGLAMGLHFRFVSQGAIGFDAETGPMFVEATAPCIAKYGASGFAPEIAAAIALFSIVPYARQSAEAFAKKMPDWAGPMHPKELGAAMMGRVLEFKRAEQK